MEQQQFKVGVSLGTKLLLSIVLLLVLVIFFLNVSTLLIVTEDKRAYIYNSQSKEALLAGKEFESLIRHSVDTLRLALASIDPTKPPVAGPNKALESVIQNQSDVLMTSVYLVVAPGHPLVNPPAAVPAVPVVSPSGVPPINPAATTQPVSAPISDKEQLVSAGQAAKDDEIKTQNLVPADYNLSSAMLEEVRASLMKNSYAYLNLSKTGKPPLFGILFADLRLKDNPTGMPVALGVVPLQSFAKAMQSLDLTVSDSSGRIFFDADATQMFGEPFGKKTLADDPLFVAARASRVPDGSQEYLKKDVKYLGSYHGAGLDLLVLDRIEWKKAIRSVYVLVGKFIFMGLMAVGAGIIFALFFSKTLTAPIQKLYQATREVAKGNFNLSLKPKGRDEIGALTSSFNVMSKKISELIKESVEKANLENELAIASTVQQTLIPPPDFKNDRILIRSHYQAATTCGGDWWGFFIVGDKLCVTIADATGHGFPSALITASARSCFSVLHKLAQEDPNYSFSPAEMLSYANRVIYESSLAKIMMTFFVGVIDFGTGEMKYSSAGHNPPWLFKREGESFTLNSLTATGTRLGEVVDAPPFEEKKIQVASGDMLFLYTDGLTEGKNLTGEMYGKKKVRKKVEATLSGGPKNVIDSLMKEFMQHNAGKPLDDDVTIAVATIIKVG